MGRLKTYLKNVVILTVTGLGLRAAGMFFRVYIAARIGAEGMGLYQLIFTLYSLCITVATAGVSVAATRLAAEELARPQPGRAKGVLGRVMGLALTFGLTAGVVQLALAWPAARFWLGDVRAAPSLALLAPSLPFMAVGSAARGYFFARRKVGPNVISQIFEQIIRIVLVLLILPGAVQKGVQYACAAVLVGSMVSEVASTLLVMWYYRRDLNRTFGDAPAQVPRGTSGRIWRILAPVEGGRCLDSALHTVENTLVPACLLAFLGSREESLAQFGALKGMAMPVLLFPFSFLTPLATLLMPEVTEAHILGRQKTLETLVGRIMLFTTTFSVLAGGLIALYAYPLGRHSLPRRDHRFLSGGAGPGAAGHVSGCHGRFHFERPGRGGGHLPLQHLGFPHPHRSGDSAHAAHGHEGLSVCDDLLQCAVRIAEYLPHREGGPHPHPLVSVVCAARADFPDFGGSGAGGPAPDGSEW